MVIYTIYLSGCSFNLRGEYYIPDELTTLTVSSNDRYSKLTGYIIKQLNLNKVDTLSFDDPNYTNVPNLYIATEELRERTLSLYQNASAAEKELTYQVSYSVTLPQLGSETFETTVSRTFLYNPLTALAKSVEHETIENEMQEQAAIQIMRQLGQIRAKYQDN